MVPLVEVRGAMRRVVTSKGVEQDVADYHFLVM